ncbi:MAG: methyltransferase [Candidatus Marinimicrobia bacterium]|nr:methyltransferase [Candidatus Neomarinimicrobiota bacterium]
MKKTTLINGDTIFCINSLEAQMLHEHITGYFDDFINLEQSDIILDIGANIGILGLDLSKKYPMINIHSFEPIDDIFSVLKANTVLSKNKNFKSYNFGISDKSESIELTYFPNAPALSSANDEIWNSKKDLIEAFDGSIQNAPSNWWWKKFIPKFTYAFFVKNLIRNKKKITCKLKPLSKVIEELSLKKIDLLKIDCEGNEHKVINGIKEENWLIINQLIIEINDIDGRLKYIENKLKKLGFKIKIIQEPALEKTNLYNLFARK